MTTVTVTENTLTANNVGLYVGDGTYVLASNFTINNNNFSGNNTGLQNAHAGEQVTAADNWWGDASGPAVAGEHPGLGDPIDGNIVYCPWLNVAYPGVVQTGRVLNQTQATVHCTIQDAIDNAVNGDTIIAGDGVFTEDIKVENKTGITLRSENGKGATTITTTATPGIEIQGTAGGFTLGGAAGQGFTIDGAAGHLIVLSNNPSGVTISYNEIDTTGTASRGISVGVAGATSLTVSNNTFTADSGDGALSAWDGPTVNVTVSGNTFQGSGAYAIQFSGVTATSTSTISGNTITGYTGAGAIVITNGTGTSDLVISGNEVTGCSYGVRFVEECIYGTAGDMTTVTVSGNTLTQNTTGIYVDNSPYIDTSGFVIDGNTIYGGNPNGYTGIKFYGGTGGTISNNLISRNSDYGIWLGQPVSFVEIIDNCIIENGYGIWIEGCHNIVGIAGHGNVIGGNTGDGVHLTTTAFGNVINYNDIAFNSSVPYGVNNENSVPVDATNNWWGDASGPAHASNPGGTGDAVSSNVQFVPWLTAAVVDTTAPTITYAAASPEMVSLWNDDMFYGAANPSGMWGLMDYGYSVGPSCETMISVKATDNNCGIARVTLNAKQLLLDLIPEEKLQKFIDLKFGGSWYNFWAAIVNQMDEFVVGLEDLEDYPLLPPSYAQNWLIEPYIDCWFSGRGPEVDGNYHASSVACLLDCTFYVLELNEVEVAEIMGQEIVLGDKQIEVTAYDFSGNTATSYISITIVDFQMPVCEGWNLRSTWLTLENNSWQDIVATMHDPLNADSILRWNSQYQRWEYYAETLGVGWYYGGVRITTDALMVPLEAYWIHSLYNDQFGLITSRGITAPPSRQMYAGWSLIGADIPWELGDESADTIFKSIEEATGHCTGYTQVLSIDQYNWWHEYFYLCGTYDYPYFGCELSYSLYYTKWFMQDTWVYVTGEPYDGQDMTRGGGYWVFMANPAVLGGFNSTPLPVGFWMYWAQHCMLFWGYIT